MEEIIMNETFVVNDVFRPYLGSLKDKAFKLGDSHGRRHPLCDYDDSAMARAINPLIFDNGVILGSKSYRRIYDKTQVFTNHLDHRHVRNRGTHTEEVVVLAVWIASLLGLNVNLVEAIALAHDFGHSPYGHLGEQFIAEFSKKDFRHEVMSVVILQKIERGGKGLNLLWEVLEGVLNHSTGKGSLILNKNWPLEYAVVLLADKIAYTFSDYNDALRLGYLNINNLPSELFFLGKNQRERMDSCVLALIKESSEKGYISFFESETAKAFERLRQWAYKNIYEKLNHEVERVTLWKELESINKFLSDYGDLVDCDKFLVMALLTDSEAKRMAEIAKGPVVGHIQEIKRFSFMEFLNRFPKGYKVDIFDPDLHVKDFGIKY